MVRAQTNLRPKELSNAITKARGRGYGARIVSNDRGIRMVIEYGGPDDHRDTVYFLNSRGLGSFVLEAISRMCSDIDPRKPCVIELLGAAEWASAEWDAVQ